MRKDNLEKLGLNYLNECFNADFKNGFLYWKKRPIEHFKTLRAMRTCNVRYSGKRAGYVRNTQEHTSYVYIQVSEATCQAHRILYFMYHKTLRLPNGKLGQIDHLDRNGLNNGIYNFRLVSNTTNGRNASVGKNNSSGVTGICWCSPSQKWRVQINTDGRQKNLGKFKSIKKAIEIRRQAEKRHGYISNLNPYKG